MHHPSIDKVLNILDFETQHRKKGEVYCKVGQPLEGVYYLEKGVMLFRQIATDVVEYMEHLKQDDVVEDDDEELNSVNALKVTQDDRWN